MASFRFSIKIKIRKILLIFFFRPNYTAESSPNLVAVGESRDQHHLSRGPSLSPEEMPLSSAGHTLTVPPLDLSVAGHHQMDSPR